MSTIQFDRETLARHYAKEHLKTDPGIEKILYLPKGTGEREIRFVELNTLVVEQPGMRRQLVPVDFGVDMGSGNEHKLYVVDVTQDQWDAIKAGTLRLPSGWQLENNVEWSS